MQNDNKMQNANTSGLMSRYDEQKAGGHKECGTEAFQAVFWTLCLLPGAIPVLFLYMSGALPLRLAAAFCIDIMLFRILLRFVPLWAIGMQTLLLIHLIGYIMDLRELAILLGAIILCVIGAAEKKDMHRARPGVWYTPAMIGASTTQAFAALAMAYAAGKGLCGVPAIAAGLGIMVTGDVLLFLYAWKKQPKHGNGDEPEHPDNMK